MNRYGIEWPPGWTPPDRHVEQVLGDHVLRAITKYASFRVRKERGKWVAEYLTRWATYRFAVEDDPLVACGLCLLYDTSPADRMDPF